MPTRIGLGEPAQRCSPISPLKKGSDPLAGLVFPMKSVARERVRPLFQRAAIVRKRSEPMGGGIGDIFWLFFMMSMLQPWLRQKMLDSARVRLMHRLERQR